LQKYIEKFEGKIFVAQAQLEFKHIFDAFIFRINHKLNATVDADLEQF